MSDHAETLRMCISQFVPEGGADERGVHHAPLRSECVIALDALVAERDRCRTALEKFAEPYRRDLYEGTSRSFEREVQALAVWVLDGNDPAKLFTALAGGET